MKSFVSRLADAVFALTHPVFWTQNYQSSKHMDELIKEVIEKDKVVGFTSNVAILKNGSGLWIENYPYAYGYLYSPLKTKSLAYRRTRAKLKEYITRKQIEISMQKRG